MTGSAVHARPLTFAVLGAFALAGGLWRQRAHHERAGKVGGAIAGAGATFPQPVYRRVGASRFKARDGHDGRIPTDRLRRRDRAVRGGTVDFGASDVPMTGAEIRAAGKKGTPVHVPTVFGAVTVSYNVAGRRRPRCTSTARPSPTSSAAGSGAGTIDRIAGAQSAAAGSRARRDHRRPPFRRVGHDQRCSRRSCRGRARGGASSVGSDKSVGWPVGVGARRRTPAWPRRCKATNGGGGVRRAGLRAANDLTTAAVRNRAGRYRGADARSDDRGRPGPARFRPTCASAIARSADPGAYPIATATFLLVYRDMCKARDRAGTGRSAS